MKGHWSKQQLSGGWSAEHLIVSHVPQVLLAGRVCVSLGVWGCKISVSTHTLSPAAPPGNAPPSDEPGEMETGLPEEQDKDTILRMFWSITIKEPISWKQKPTLLPDIKVFDVEYNHCSKYLPLRYIYTKTESVLNFCEITSASGFQFSSAHYVIYIYLYQSWRESTLVKF